MPYDEAETRIVSADALHPRGDQPLSLPRLAVVGEFSSGKSTLLNLLLGQDILPVKATATASPAIWLSYGQAEGFYIEAGGNRKALPEGGIADVPSDSRYIRLWSSADFLQSCDVLDLSGLADPGRTDDQTYDMLAEADCIIWCTPATQAWRQSERAAWLAVPEKVRARSILAVTRIDKLRNAEDLARVMRRVAHEADGLFTAFAPISALMAERALASDDEAAWSQSGIDRLTEALFNQLQALGEGRDQSRGQFSEGQGETVPVIDLPTADQAAAEAAEVVPAIIAATPPETEETNSINALAEESEHSTHIDLPSEDRAEVEEVLILTQAALAEPADEAEPPEVEPSAHSPYAPEGEKPEPLILTSPKHLAEIEQEIPVGDATAASPADREATEKTNEFDISAFTQQLMAVEDDPSYDGDLTAQLATTAPDVTVAVAPEPLSPKPGQRIDHIEPIAPAAEPSPAEPLAGAATMIPGIEAALQRVLVGYFGAKLSPPDAPTQTQGVPSQASSSNPPQEVLIWREIAARTEMAEPLKPIVSMIDELLSRLFDPTQTRPTCADQARASDLL